ncbi:MAG: ABC-2 transporter permease [Oscillospiraceae bacterium]|jgi:hypothetical protein|nr:ABC-2 transporter permease [Oscillospiraceae bacterium]
MRNLLRKEWKLAMHPTAILFLVLSFLLLIPNYPYYVTFFYTCLGIFFICLSGRENQDLLYTMLLPVRKRDIVRSRILTAVTLELLQAVIAVPAAILRNRMPMNNEVGMDANIALFAFSFILMGLFNLFFFTRYYRTPDKIGRHFALASGVVFVYITAAETLTHIVPFFRDELDTKDPQFLPQKLLVLLIGIVAYALLTFAACRKSERSFEKLDLTI